MLLDCCFLHRKSTGGLERLWWGQMKVGTMVCIGRFTGHWHEDNGLLSIKKLECTHSNMWDSFSTAHRPRGSPYADLVDRKSLDHVRGDGLLGIGHPLLHRHLELL